MPDPIARREALPSLGLLDLDKVKRESAGYSHHVPSTIAVPAPPLSSPSSSAYSRPPPPYSFPSSASSSAVGSNGGPHSGKLNGSFPTTRPQYTPVEERDQPTYAASSPPRQTLPPLNEALSINSILTTTAPPRPSISAQSPISPGQRPKYEAFSRSYESYRHPSPKDTRPLEQERPPLSSYSPRQTNHYRTTPPLPNGTYNAHPVSQPLTASETQAYARPGLSTLQRSYQTSSHQPPPPPPPPPPSSLPPQSFRHEETTQSTPTYAYQPAYSYPQSTPTIAAYQQPYADRWRSSGVISEQERAEEVRKAIPRDSPPGRYPYGEYVKRHLDIFDLETSLNEIAEGGGRALDFAQLYGTKAHQTQRSGPIPGSLPSESNCNEMLEQFKKMSDAMFRIKDVIVKQQQALNEQRKYEQQNYKNSADNAEQDNHQYADRTEGGGGFAGPDAKKRRGRAAPPGRCHSCNRAETPEWRRGPDGARTLCNACGLHYAKVTRKLGQKGAAAGSNLRPKEDPSSP